MQRAILGLLLMTLPFASVMPAQSPSFEVASIKPAKPDGNISVDMAGGRLTAIGVSLRDLLRMAYPGPSGAIRTEDQIVGGPSWIGVDRFEILATGGPLAIDSRRAAGAVSPREGAELSDLRAKLQNLLAERFHVTLHHDTRDFPTFRLSAARSDGRFGPQLLRSDVDCGAESNPSPDAMKAACGGFRMLKPGHIVTHAVTMTMLVSLFSQMPAIGRAVTDQTGLSGTFDVDLTFAPPNSADPDAPSIFTAVQEQLGLRLEAARTPVDVLVIDHVEPLTSD
jgi:uncharacterized protein (TIGR03435 family)